MMDSGSANHDGVLERKVEVSNRVGTQSATYVLRNEGHTLGNALRAEVMKNPSVDLCGYTMPHPMEDLIKIRVQAKCDSGTSSSECLKEGLDALSRGADEWIQKFDKALESTEVENVAELDISELLKKA